MVKNMCWCCLYVWSPLPIYLSFSLLRCLMSIKTFQITNKSNGCSITYSHNPQRQKSKLRITFISWRVYAVHLCIPLTKDQLYGIRFKTMTLPYWCCITTEYKQQRTQHIYYSLHCSIAHVSTWSSGVLKGQQLVPYIVNIINHA